MVSFNSKKAQSSMEFLILMGFLTFVITAILAIGYIYSGTINDRIKSSQVESFANKITSTSETVFYSGEPSRATISVHLPDSVDNVEIVDDAIVITYHLTSGNNKRSFSSNVPIVENISSQISSVSGIKSMLIVANSSHAIISQN